MKDFKKYYQLWNKCDEFSDEDMRFLKSYIKTKNFKVKYGFYNKISSNKRQIAVIFDLIPAQTRRTGVENNWEVICTRAITDREIEEFIYHYFKSSFKRFLVFYYANVDRLIQDDEKLGSVTPEDFVEKCRSKGYSGAFQLKIDFIDQCF